MSYTDDFIEFYCGFQDDISVGLGSYNPLKNASRNNGVVLFSKLPQLQDYRDATTEFTSKLEVTIPRQIVSYTETFTNWNSTDDFNKLLFNFDPLVIPFTGTEVAFNCIEIIDALHNTLTSEALLSTLDFTRITDDPSTGFARYTITDGITFQRDHRVFHPTSSSTYTYDIDEPRLNEFVTRNPIPGVLVGGNISVRNANKYTIARFFYETDIILPADSGLNFDVGSLELTFTQELPFC